MGFYVRKAIRVGPVRFNFSQSGVGLSAGIKGLRLGTGPRGNYVHMGRGGLYFRQTLPSHNITPTVSRVPRLTEGTVGPMEEIDSGSVEQMADANSTDLLNELNEKKKKIGLLPITVLATGVGVVLAAKMEDPVVLAGSLVAAFLLCWLAASHDALRRTTVIFYRLEPDVEQLYQQIHDGFAYLRACGGTWHKEAEASVNDGKYHAGAGALVRRHRIGLRLGQPPLVKTNIEVPLLPVGKQTVAFMPDRLLVFEATGVGAISYSDLNASRSSTRFIESDAMPADATVVGKTWQYVNKSGGPDRRFKNNRELPICLYDEVHLTSTSGLNEIIQISKEGGAEKFALSLLAMKTPAAKPTATSL